jgi:hypothetical protein
MPIKAQCYECDNQITIGIYDDPALSGASILVCNDCRDSFPDFPESNIWDVSKIEEAHENYSGDAHPNIPDFNPLDNGEEWSIINVYRDRETYLPFYEAMWDGKVTDSIRENMEVPSGERWDIFVYNSEDKSAVNEARRALWEKVV